MTNTSTALPSHSHRVVLRFAYILHASVMKQRPPRCFDRLVTKQKPPRCSDRLVMKQRPSRCFDRLVMIMSVRRQSIACVIAATSQV